MRKGAQRGELWSWFPNPPDLSALNLETAYSASEAKERQPLEKRKKEEKKCKKENKSVLLLESIN